MFFSLFYQNQYLIFILIIFCFLPLYGQTLLINDTLQDSTIGQLLGNGQFIQSGGWKSTAKGVKIIFDAGHPIIQGYFEATMRGYSTPAQGINKSHPLAGWEIENQYAREDQQGSYFNWRIGTNYSPFKVFAKPIVGGDREEKRVGNNSMVNDGHPHIYRVEWNNGWVTYKFDDIVLVTWKLPRFQLQFFTIGSDDQYGITNPSPIISNVVIIDRGLPPSDTLKILTENLKEGEYLHHYSDTLDVMNGTPPFQWSLIEGNLPDGLELNSETGTIQGTPQSSGIYLTTFVVEDFNEWMANDSISLSLIINNQKPILISDDSIQVMINQPFNYTAQAVDSDDNPIQYEMVDFPSWISWTDSIAMGVTPEAPHDTSMTWIATDSDLSDTLKVTIQVLPETMQIQIDSLPRGKYLIPYQVDLNVTGGIPPYHWEIDGDLPQGLIFNSDSSKINGIPLESGNFNLVIIAKDSRIPPNQDTHSAQFKILNSPPQLTFPDKIWIPSGESFLYLLPVNDPENHPTMISLIESPSWLSLSGKALEGNPPVQAQDTTFTLQVSDGDLTNTYTIEINFEITNKLHQDVDVEPVAFALKQNYPNPLNPETMIEFSVAEPCQVSLKLFNTKGQIVRQITDRYYTRGTYRERLDGRILAAGIYYYTIKMGDYNAVRKLTVIK